MRPSRSTSGFRATTDEAGETSRNSQNSHLPASGYRRTSFDLAEPLRQALALIAVQEDRPMVAIVEEAVVQWIREHGYEFEEGSRPVSARSLATDRPTKGRRKSQGDSP